MRCLAHQDGARLGDGLKSRGRVDEVAGDHALVRCAEGDGRLAGQDTGPGLDRRAQRPHAVDEFERRPDRPLGVILVGRRGAPDGHDGVADELLDRPAVAGDHVAGHVEVAGQELASVLRVATLSQGREPDEVGEEDRDDPSLGNGRRRNGRHGPARRRDLGTGRQRRAAVAAEALAGRILCPAR